MRQKLVIASVLLHEPKVIVIDEPMVGLDPKGARQEKDLLAGAARNGTTVFLSTHTLSIAQEICDRIGIIHNGRLIAAGTMNELNEKAHTQAQQLEQVFLQLTEEENRPQRTDPL
jgi:ABC-2 type transport system ATP-binding protein